MMHILKGNLVKIKCGTLQFLLKEVEQGTYKIFKSIIYKEKFQLLC